MKRRVLAVTIATIKMAAMSVVVHAPLPFVQPGARHRNAPHEVPNSKRRMKVLWAVPR